MSHEIETAVFSAAEGAGWTGLGQVIPESAARDPAKIAELCSATYTVSKVGLVTESGNSVPRHQAIVRDDTGDVLSVVSTSRYKVDGRQPIDIFEAFRDELAKENMVISHAAVLKRGATLAVCAHVPGRDMIVGNGDPVKTYVTLSTGYDGQHGTKATVGGTRVVCNNTLNYSLAEAEKTGKYKTIKASTAIEKGSLADMLANIDGIVSDQQRLYDRLANAKLSDADISRLFADVLAINIEDLNRVDSEGKPVVSTRSRNMLSDLLASYKNAPGADIARGTAWGALNAVTHYATHIKTVRDTASEGNGAARTFSNMYGDSARIKAEALALLTEKIAA